MKLGLMLPVKPDLQWTLASQLGVKYAVTKAAPELSGMNDPSDYDALKVVRDRFAEAGFVTGITVPVDGGFLSCTGI